MQIVEIPVSTQERYQLVSITEEVKNAVREAGVDEGICLISSTASVLTASPKTPWKSLKDLLADAKARPGQITVGATLASTSHFFPALIEKATGVKFKYVSYEGLAPRMNAILGGHIDLTDSNLTQKGKVEAGQLKFLGIATEKRSAEMQSVPTLKETGVNVVYDTRERRVVARRYGRGREH